MKSPRQLEPDEILKIRQALQTVGIDSVPVYPDRILKHPQAELAKARKARRSH